MEKEKTKPNNPLAFPSEVGSREALQKGMTLRDYFAAKAMNGYLSASIDLIGHGMPIDAKNIANECYLIADAMLKQREL